MATLLLIALAPLVWLDMFPPLFSLNGDPIASGAPFHPSRLNRHEAKKFATPFAWLSRRVFNFVVETVDCLLAGFEPFFVIQHDHDHDL
jgi:hypothetical protein